MQSVWCTPLMHGWGKIRLGIGTWNCLWLCCAQALKGLDDLNTRTLGLLFTEAIFWLSCLVS